MNDTNIIHCGDNRGILEQYPDNYFDAFLEDVPYGLIGKNIDINTILEAFDKGQSYKKGKGFMNREWDGFILGTDFTKIRYDKLKPGGYCIMFCSPITIGLFQVSLWKVGFEMVTTFVWNYGSDFNKSKHRVKELTEFIIVAQKPIEAGLTIKQNIEKWGCGGLNIDEGRIGNELRHNSSAGNSGSSSTNIGYNQGVFKGSTEEKGRTRKGRVPSNVILSHTEYCVCYGEKKVKNYGKSTIQKGGTSFAYGSGNRIQHNHFLTNRYGNEDGYETVEDWDCVDGCPVKEMGKQKGLTKSTGGINPRKGSMFGTSKKATAYYFNYQDKGTVARYFYNSKTSPNERHAGCEDLLWQIYDNSSVGYSFVDAQKWLNLEDTQKRRGNIHPTVKPINLGQIFARLLTSKKDGHIPVVCDGFCGSGSLLIGLMYEGLNYVGIELNPEYHLIANTRMEYAKKLLEQGKHINDVKVKMKTPEEDSGRLF